MRVYGYSRTRDKKGRVVKRDCNPYVNCIHTRVGTARDNMEVLVAEVEEDEQDINVNNDNMELPKELSGKKFRIRKLTPREVFRLMDVDDSDIDLIQSVGLSNSAQYKLGGNSICVNVLFHIFRKMFIETNEPDFDGKPTQLTLF